MTEKKRLGRGLGALIPEVLDNTATTNEIMLEKIKPNPYQPRKDFDQDKIEELANSIKTHGVLQPVVVSPEDDEKSFTLVAGERRCRAAKLAGLKTIPALIKDVDKKTMLEIALIENLQRENLNPVDEALAYKRLMQEYSYTQEELAIRLGRSRPSIANSVRLLGLPEEILDALKTNNLSPGQARPLLAISEPEIQKRAAEQIAKEGLSAREAEKLVSKQNKSSTIANQKIVDQNSTPDPVQAELQAHIQRYLGTKVNIKTDKNGGTIEIYYYGEEDLERLVEKLLPGGLK